MSQGGHIAVSFESLKSCLFNLIAFQLGVFVGLASTSIQSLGLTLQRKSHILEDEKETQDTKRPPYRRRRWQVRELQSGREDILIYIDWSAYVYCFQFGRKYNSDYNPTSTSFINSSSCRFKIRNLLFHVLTKEKSGLVFNSICATLILGEAFTRYSFAGTVLVSGGALLIALFGAINEPTHSLDQLLVLLGRKQFILWMAGTAVMVIAILAAARFTKVVAPQHGHTPKAKLLQGMAYGGVSGILSAHSLLVAKSAVELLVKTIVDGDNQFNRFPSWAILLGLIALALSQLYFLHRGLKLCSTSVLYPFVFCVYNIIAILDGLIYFHQTSQLSLLSSLLVSDFFQLEFMKPA
jgi:magnesium transporter